MYYKGYYEDIDLAGGIWEEQKINHEVELVHRQVLEAQILYHAYHYNDEVRTAGDKYVMVNIPNHMICGIDLVQKEMQKSVARKGIAIETNPTSNLKIGGLAGYQDHPIVSFYNKGLSNDPEQLMMCPQINVSINTDDNGVFSTCLYNEYSQMAGALEDMKDESNRPVYKKDMVYDWIDHVREMGNEQSFKIKGKGQ